MNSIGNGQKMLVKAAVEAALCALSFREQDEIVLVAKRALDGISHSFDLVPDVPKHVWDLVKSAFRDYIEGKKTSETFINRVYSMTLLVYVAARGGVALISPAYYPAGARQALIVEVFWLSQANIAREFRVMNDTIKTDGIQKLFVCILDLKETLKNIPNFRTNETKKTAIVGAFKMELDKLIGDFPDNERGESFYTKMDVFCKNPKLRVLVPMLLTLKKAVYWTSFID